jgi:hypothetical protein
VGFFKINEDSSVFLCFLPPVLKYIKKGFTGGEKRRKLDAMKRN